jgi:hypothetical protein
MFRSGDTVAIVRFNHRHEAEIARGFLEESGIAAIVRADDGGGAFGAPLSFSLGSFAEVYVVAENVERARRILGDAGYEGVDGGDSLDPQNGTPDSVEG